MGEWFSSGSLEAQQRLLAAWPDAPLGNEEICELILTTAADQVVAYARYTDLFTPSGDPIPPSSRLVYAQLQQAKNLWNAGRVSSDGEVSSEYTFTPRPLDKTIRGIIRPVDGRPHVL